jgi:hypothetical protein
MRLIRFIPYLPGIKLAVILSSIIIVAETGVFSSLVYLTPLLVFSILATARLIQWLIDKFHLRGHEEYKDITTPWPYEQEEWRKEWKGLSNRQKRKLLERERWAKWVDEKLIPGRHGLWDITIEMLLRKETLGYKDGSIYTGMSKTEWQKLSEEEKEKVKYGVRHMLRWGWIIPRLREIFSVIGGLTGAYYLMANFGLPIWSIPVFGIAAIFIYQFTIGNLSKGRFGLSYPALWNVLQPTLCWLFSIPVLQYISGLVNWTFWPLIAFPAQIILIFFFIFMLRTFVYTSQAILNSKVINKKRTFTVRYNSDVRKALEMIRGENPI